MINYKYGYLFEQDSVNKQLTISVSDGTMITNELLDSENFSLTESICSNDNLTFGSCEASCVKFRVNNIVDSLIGKTIDVYFTLNGNTDVAFQVGKYKVYSDVPTADRSWRDIVAYDAMYDIINADVAAWYNGLTFPTTLKQFRDSFVVNFGLTAVETTLVNDNMLVGKSVAVTPTTDDTIGEKMSGKDVAFSICEINGVFGHINREGKFEFKKINSNQTAYEIEDRYHTGTTKYEDYVTDTIQCVQIREEENDIGVYVGDRNKNTYIIQGNFLVYGKDSETLTTIANNFLSVVGSHSYRPFECDMQGNPCLEVGDKVFLETSTQDITSFVLSRKLNGIQALKDSLSSKGEEVYPSKVNGVSNSILQLKGISNSLKRSITETNSTIANIAEGLRSEIKQTADSFSVQISNLQDKIDGNVFVYITDEEPTLLNYPAWDFTHNIPCDDTVQTTDDLHFEYKPEYYDMYLRCICYDQTNDITYRFQKDDDGNYFWNPIADTEYSAILEKVAKLEVKADGISAEVSEVKQELKDDYLTSESTRSLVTQTSNSIKSEVSAEYVTKSTMDDYYTKSEANSKILQTESRITTSVSETYETKNESSRKYSQIDQKADEIEISVSNETARAGKAEQALSSRISVLPYKISLETSSSSGSANITLTVQDENGNVTKQSSKIDITAASISLTADDIMNILSNNTMNLSAKKIAISSNNFNVDTSGNVTMHSAAIDGGDINLGSGKFHVDKYGNVTMTSASVTGGSINLADKFVVDKNGNAEMTSAKINGGSINLGNGVFKVDSNGNVTMQSATISGFVKSTDLSGNGTTTINGNNIKTGKINCNLLEGGVINGQTIYGGSINIKDKFIVDVYGNAVMNSARMTGNSNDNYLYLYSLSGNKGFKLTNYGFFIRKDMQDIANFGGNYYTEPARITENEALLTNLSTIGDVQLLDGNLYVKGSMIFSYHLGGWYMSDDTWIRAYNNKNIYSAGEIRGGKVRSDGDMECYGNLGVAGTCGATGLVAQQQGIEIYGNSGQPTPFIDFHFSGNTSDYTARIIEASRGSIKVYNSISNASDERLKKDIVDIDKNILQLIDYVNPKEYRFKKGDDYKKLGFIAQEVDKALDDIGIEDKPIIVYPENENDYYGLDYNDMIAILWKEAQAQRERANKLETELSELKEILKSKGVI